MARSPAAAPPDTTISDQPALDMDPLDGQVGATQAALLRSITAGRATRIITSRDDAAVAAALAIASSLDQAIAYGATLETVVKGTTALRAYLAALNLTPASRDEDAYVEHDEQGTDPDWVAGAGQVSHPAD
jgi:hypothetical protein